MAGSWPTEWTGPNTSLSELPHPGPLGLLQAKTLMIILFFLYKYCTRMFYLHVKYSLSIANSCIFCLLLEKVCINNVSLA